MTIVRNTRTWLLSDLLPPLRECSVRRGQPMLKQQTQTTNFSHSFYHLHKYLNMEGRKEMF